SFEGPTPARSELYWRALTLDRFDGRRWSQSARAAWQAPPHWQARGEALDYSIVLQPSGQPWLLALDVGEGKVDGAQMMSDFRWQQRRPVDRPQLYQMRSWPQALREPQASAQVLRHALQLPQQGDPR